MIKNKNLFLFKNKQKGVSPIITIILIIIIGVGLIASFTTWAKDDTQQRLQQAYEMIPSANDMECSRSTLDVQSCYIDPYSNHLKLLLSNPSTLDYRGLTLSFQVKDSNNNEFKVVGAFDGNLESGHIKDFKTYKDFYFLKQDRLFSTIDASNIDLITLSSRTCPRKVIDISDCNIYSTINEDLVAWYPLDKNSEIFGDNLIVNGDFSNWTNDNPDNWSVYEDDVTFYVEENNGGARMYSEGNAVSLSQNILDLNKNYIYNFDVIEDNGGVIILEVENDSQKLIYFTSIGHYNDRFRAIIGDTIKFKRSVPSDMTIDNIVINEIQTLNIVNGSGVSLYGNINYNNIPSGDVNKALYFDGINTYLNLNLNENYPTQSFWFKTNSTNEQILTAGISGDIYDSLTLNNMHLTIADNGGVSEKIRTINTYQTNTWYHVIVIKTDVSYPNTYKIYVNGVLQDTEIGGGNRVSGGCFVGVRYYSGEYSYYFDGSMSDLRIYNKELSSKEIEELYLSTKSKYIIE